MTPPSNSLGEIIKRLESASGPDRELDALICCIAERPRAIRWYWTGATGMPRQLPDDWDLLKGGMGSASIRAMAPSYTASIDAALTLVPDNWTRAVDATMPEAGIEVALHRIPSPNRRGSRKVIGDHACEAIAICIAALKTRARILVDGR